MKRVYASKKDAWIVILLWAAALVMLIAAANLYRAPTPLPFRLVMVALLTVMAALVFWVLYGTRYTLTDDALIVQSGPFRWVVDLGAISEVSPTRNPQSSPACSLDRLHLRYHPSPTGLMISPRDKAGFLRDLVARSLGLTVEGERALRKKP